MIDANDDHDYDDNADGDDDDTYKISATPARTTYEDPL